MKYSFEFAKRRLALQSELVDADALSANILDLEHEIEQRELTLLRESDPEAFRERLWEIEFNSLRDEADSIDDEAADVENRDVICMLEARLQGFLSSEMRPEA
jgi:hypothetical protein